MDGSSRDDIRRMLKNFGIQADETIVAHLARNPRVSKLKLKLVLEDLTDYTDSAPEGVCHLELEGVVQR
jgi:hypothetical protein